MLSLDSLRDYHQGELVRTDNYHQGG